MGPIFMGFFGLNWRWKRNRVRTVGASGIAVDLRQEGLGSVLRDMMAPQQKEACA